MNRMNLDEFRKDTALRFEDIVCKEKQELVYYQEFLEGKKKRHYKVGLSSVYEDYDLLIINFQRYDNNLTKKSIRNISELFEVSFYNREGRLKKIKYTIKDAIITLVHLNLGIKFIKIKKASSNNEETVWSTIVE